MFDLNVETVENSKIVAILRGVKPDEILDIGEALVSAGISIFEIPLNSPEPFDSIKLATSTFKGRAIVGAGTVLTMSDVDKVADAGGQIIVSPNMNVDVIKQSRARGMLSFPGVMTPTDAFTALSAGASGIKLFPGDAVGPGFVKALRAVLPGGTKICAVSGVSADNVDVWFKSGVDMVGIGSGVYRAGYSSQIVHKRAKSIVEAVKLAV